jgi:hypothetical protein
MKCKCGAKTTEGHAAKVANGYGPHVFRLSVWGDARK